MLHQHEREALAMWWHETGRHISSGFLTGMLVVGLPIALMVGFTIN